MQAVAETVPPARIMHDLGLVEGRAQYGGIGDLDTDGYNILVSLEGYNRERLDQDQRDLTKSGIYTDKPGGRWNGWSAKGAQARKRLLLLA